MLKRLICFAFLLLQLVLSVNEANATSHFDVSKLRQGIIGVGNISASKRLKLRIQKGNDKYDYDLNNKGQMEYFPLQMGNGEYKVVIYENTSGTKYRTLESNSVSLNLENSNVVYLNSIQNVFWTSQSKAIQFGQAEGGKKKDASGKFDLFYQHMVSVYAYDYEKAKTVATGYNPNIDVMFNTKKGICYDYSSLLAALDRSNGIPTKLVKGYAAGVDGYHAWNEVFIDGKWYVIDTTVDAVFHQGGKKYVKLKNTSDYRKAREY